MSVLTRKVNTSMGASFTARHALTIGQTPLENANPIDSTFDSLLLIFRPSSNGSAAHLGGARNTGQDCESRTTMLPPSRFGPKWQEQPLARTTDGFYISR